jgi:hypothetical protein
MITLFTILLLIVLVGLAFRILAGSGHQFPTAYQLLKSSPGIDRRERIAIYGILVLMAVFLLLAVTALF